ncbi:uncharacterized protein EI90DRAFT_2928123, partial [Cantharellus anzutake]|uniref:uncharacterized protein n=1 Tax=Cantharellus anzutake TaxID=1750568 RepID=UPI0019079284
LLVLQENKTLYNKMNPESQVIGEAIATFQHNNIVRRTAKRPGLNVITIPCIYHNGWNPTHSRPSVRPRRAGTPKLGLAS